MKDSGVEFKSRIYEKDTGWKAVTYFTRWEIVTEKKGYKITCLAIAGVLDKRTKTYNRNGKLFKVKLIESEAKATQEKIRSLHEKGMRLFATNFYQYEQDADKHKSGSLHPLS